MKFNPDSPDVVKVPSHRRGDRGPTATVTQARAMKALGIAFRIETEAENDAIVRHAIWACHNPRRPGTKGSLQRFVDHCRGYPSDETLKLVAMILSKYSLSGARVIDTPRGEGEQQ